MHDIALKYFKAGQIEAAEAELKKLLSRKPQYVPSLYLLGLIEHNRGHFKIAADLCHQAIVTDPKNRDCHHILGLALSGQGKLDDAVESLRRAIGIGPPSPQILNNLGTVLKSKGRLEEAASCYLRAVELNSHYVPALNNFGTVLSEQKHFEEAIAVYHRILDLNPDYAETHNNLGIVFEAMGSLTKAEECYRQAIAIKPDYAEAYYNLGLIQKKSGLIAESEENLLRSLALRPANAEALQILGIAQKYQGHIGDAIESLNRAVSLNPNLVDAHYSLANLQLARGDFANGWRGYEWRLRASWYGNRTFEKPMWSCEDLREKAILLHSEQGFGDTIQFLRYAPLMALRAGRVIVEVPRPLAHVAATLRGRGQVIATGDPVPEFDFYLPLPSLPGRLATSAETIPNQVPYLFAHEPLIKKWQEEIRDPARLTIGLAWAGNPKHETNQYRSIDVETLESILSLPGIRWFSLQVGERAADLTRLSSGTVIDLSPRLTDFAETAAVIANLDLVITVDTAIAHLAGAMGRPVWVLVSSIPDWRYFPTPGEYNAWYPTMRVFRQTKLKNWNDLLSRVCGELRELASGYRYVQQIAFQPSVDPAEDQLIQILANNPRDFDSINRLALSIGKKGQHKIAEQLLLRALLLMPNSAAAHKNLGVAQYQTGKIECAIGSLRRALAFNPNYPEAFNNLGCALAKNNNLDEAIHSYSSALKLKPDYPEAICNLAVALKDRGQLDAAVENLRRAIELNPTYPEAQTMLGLVLLQKGELNEAISCFKDAVRLRPDSAEAYNNLAVALGNRGNLDEALRSYLKALDLTPNFPALYNNRGNLLVKQGRLTEAIESFRKALELKPDYAGAQNNLGNALRDRGRFVEALQCYRQAIAQDPGYTAARSNLLFCLNYMPDLALQEIYAEHKAWEQSLPRLSDKVLFSNTVDPNRRIRIGYLSGDFKSHSVAFFFEPLLMAHDHHAFEVFCYSNVDKEDSVTTRIRAHADHWVSVTGIDASAVAERIRHERVDILIDLGGHTSGGCLSVFPLKPAPIQVSWLGYPNTTGLTTIDYRITDAIADPEAEAGRYHSERLIRLPNPFLCYDPPAKAPPVAELPALTQDHVTFGSFNNLTKVTFQVVTQWAKVLRAVEGSRLIIKAKQLADASTATELIERFSDEGISAERLELLPWQPGTQQHLAHYNRIDIALDTFPYNGTTTTCEAILMGVPVVCLRGDRHSARVGASILTAMHLDELIANDLESYVTRAVRLANDLNRCASLRAFLRARMLGSLLCNPFQFARNMEKAYRTMWQRWCGVDERCGS
jgi:predicted O-linked N-acetylglucosamine transferase (SPINDLY family)